MKPCLDAYKATMSSYRADADAAFSLFQHLRLDELNQTSSNASQAAVAQPDRNNGPAMLKLPNEILGQISGHLVSPDRICKKGGYGFILEQQEHFTPEMTRSRQTHASSTQDLLNLALTCKRLAEVAQDTLYRNVLLPQPRKKQPWNEEHVSPFRCLLRTMIERPDLAAHVRHFAIWVWKSKPARLHDLAEGHTISACGTCLPHLMGIINTIPLSPKDKKLWMTELEHSTEATVTSLLLLSLPNLRSLELYLRPLPSNMLAGYSNKGDISARQRYTPPHDTEVVRLSHALSNSRTLTQLTLSPNLNGLATFATLPSLTTLILDFTSANQFVRIPRTAFRKVSVLKIQCTSLEFLAATNPNHRTHHQPHLQTRAINARLDEIRNYLHTFPQKLSILLRALPSVRTLEFESGAAAARCDIPASVEKVVIRPAEWDAVQWVREFLEGKMGGVGVGRVEVVWKDESDVHVGWVGVQERARRRGVKVIVIWRGEVRRVLG